MEDDSNLDDFFAKKDKSKKKSKNKVAGEKTEKTEKKKVKKKKDTAPTADSTNKDGTADTEDKKETNFQSEDAEWIDYETEEKDLTGLRIQTLQLCGKDDEETQGVGSGAGEDNEENDDDGEGVEKRDRSEGPWNKSGSTQKTSVIEEPVPAPVEAPKEEAPKATGKYMPPGMRRAAAMGEGGPSSGGPQFLRKKKQAPNIQSDVDFPTLGGGPGGYDGDHGSSFEQVRTGGRMEDTRAHSMKLELGNKFGALTQD